MKKNKITKIYFLQKFCMRIFDLQSDFSWIIKYGKFKDKFTHSQTLSHVLFTLTTESDKYDLHVDIILVIRCCFSCTREKLQLTDRYRCCCWNQEAMKSCMQRLNVDSWMNAGDIWTLFVFIF